MLNIELCQLYSLYLIRLNEYNKILKMRNEYIRNSNIDFHYLDIITDHLIDRAICIMNYRDQFIAQINDKIGDIFYKIMKVSGLRVHYDRSLPSVDKEELKKYNEWKESQKTEAEKQSEVLVENEKLKNRITELENMQVVANASVDSKFQKFVLSEVLQMEGEFEDNLKDYLKENPQYLQTKETVETPKTTGVPVQKNNNSEDDGVMAILKAKHPEAF